MNDALAGRRFDLEAVWDEIITSTGLDVPDGRPLHAYRLPAGGIRKLGEEVGRRVASGWQPGPKAAAVFVFWAAEHIRSTFPGGQLTWRFIFQALGRPEDRKFGVDMVERGLAQWKRSVRRSESERHFYLYSLMAEGGLPEALLAELGQYRRVVLGLLGEIEAEGGMQAAAVAKPIALRWAAILPQAFQTTDFVDLLAELGRQLVELRANVPADLPAKAAERWLDAHHPGWTTRLPLRISPAVVETLIRPALAAECGALTLTERQLATRELHRDIAGRWHGRLRLVDQGWLPSVLLPVEPGLRLRLLPLGAASQTGEALVFSATPETGGWQLRRFGKSGTALVSLSPEVPFALAAFADGRPKGEVVLDPGLPAADEAPSLWRAADPADGADALRLVPQAGAGVARAAHLWLLAPDAVTPMATLGLSLAGSDPAPGGQLWRLAGTGSLAVGTRTFRIQTGAETEAPEARLVAVGPMLRGWRQARDGGVVHCGEPSILGAKGASGLRAMTERELRVARLSGRTLFGRIVEWVENGESLARLRLVCLPPEVRLLLREDGPGRVVLTAEGLPARLRLALAAGGTTERVDVVGGSACVVLSVAGAPPGQVVLRLSDPGSGGSLDLVSTWPARTGMILDPDGARIEVHRPIAADGLRGWRAIVPENEQGFLQLRLDHHAPVALPVAGEVILAAHLPSIRAMLALGGPDAQVGLSLIVAGNESRRLEIRRYHDHAVVKEGRLFVGLPRDGRDLVQLVPAGGPSPSMVCIHAVDLAAPQPAAPIEIAVSADLQSVLGAGDGLWLIQARLQGRMQRAVAWAAQSMPWCSRKERIETYAADLRRLMLQPAASAWDLLWRLIVAVGQGGDAGVADQVQALGQAPEAAIMLTLRVPRAELADALALDNVAPLFWPVLPIRAFAQAVRAAYDWWQTRFLELADAADAAEEAEEVLASRIAAVLTVRPELAGHFGAALAEVGLIRLAFAPANRDALRPMLVPRPGATLADLAQDAARRFDRLPEGILAFSSPRRPMGCVFQRHMQAMIDAPLVLGVLDSAVNV